MICGACGIKNDDSAERCAHCGALLHLAEPKTRGKACRGCGFENPPHSKFCGRCGADLRFYGRTAKKNPTGKLKKSGNESMFARVLKWHPLVVITGLFGILFILIAAVQMIQNARTSAVPLPAQEIKSVDPKIEGGVQAIASRYLCSCGSCQEEPLNVCTCGKAVEVREFIREKLQAGQTGEQVMAAVDQAYGWKRNGAASSEDLPDANPTGRTKISVPAETAGQFPASIVVSAGSRVATAANREEIFSHFRCPCGQCGMDDLASCSCTHPHGATEVKAFVDRRIAEGKFTIAQLVNEIDRQYGGRRN